LPFASHQLRLPPRRRLPMRPVPSRVAPEASTGPKSAGEQGTSLVELMMGLLILVILITLSTPGLASLVGRYYTRSAAEDLMYASDLARSRARANRRAYAVQVGGLGVDGELFKVVVRRGAGTSCESANATNGEVVFTADYSKGNTAGNPSVAVLRRAPAELLAANHFLCFKPDGRVVRSDTGLAYRGPAAGYLAGDVYYELSRVAGTTPVGDKLQVQIGYNGSIRLTYGHDLDKLVGVN
jgi:Tfp pilus assembly protein FimT